MTKEGKTGLVYRGPFIFRQGSGGVRELEGVECREGKLTAEKAYIYIKDHLGSVVAVVDGTSSEVVESSEYDSYGRRTQLLGGSEEAENRLLREHFSGKEDQMPEFGVDYTDFGARLYSPTIRRWLTQDPLSEKYYGVSPYAYCAGNPVNYVDPDGKRVEVKKNDDGTYTVVGGTPNDDQSMYLIENGTYIFLGHTLTKYSFMSDEGNPVIGSIVNLDDRSGQDFLDNFITNPPSLRYYINNAGNNKEYDFKSNDIPAEIDDSKIINLYYNRGMTINLSGVNLIASARDIGNFAAGYISAYRDLPWGVTRLGFDAYNLFKNIKGCIKQFTFTESETSQSAQSLGYLYSSVNQESLLLIWSFFNYEF